jgi:DNA-binding response OmpR family regulator
MAGLPPNWMKLGRRARAACVMRRRMKVKLTGQGAGMGQVAAALLAGGFELVAGEPCDLVLTAQPGSVPPPTPENAGNDLLIDLTRRHVRLRDRVLRLTPIEFSMLGYLAQAGRPVSREELLRELWGCRFDPGTNSVAVHVSRLRGKIGRDAIATAGDSYRLALAADVMESTPLR